MADNLDVLKEQLTRLNDEVTKAGTVAAFKAEFVAGFKSVVTAVQATRKELNDKIDARLAQIRDGRDGKDGRAGRDGKDGAPGAQGPVGPQGESIQGPAGRDGSPDDAIDIRTKLEFLEGEERLDASAIKNLPEMVESTYQSVGMHGALWSLQDVDIAGILAGQSIQWDGIKWVAYTPAGSGGTPVWGEDLTPQGPGTAYTLAHAPVAGTVRVFRGGTYQQAGAGGDYTLSGSTITFGTTTQQGEVVLADYSYA